VPTGADDILYLTELTSIVGIDVKFVLLVIVGTDNEPVKLIEPPVIVPVNVGLFIVKNGHTV
jgi:hypothetical protein